ncbi:PIG-L deacetylase family protein [Ornithinicoccus hortensis]|uniref:LmbE family N-acetylglucosaminyl deacetylase n=1 Tax=Ornithinicoccus hortensis TaxID=82346 RepID=A0A542YQ79_9MICO|nr:PIG-L family deacetylase [Ornithinicoccus hortensis]TQL50219.1 LmbE family N-acetylglucosaminyl deacetylase [Ornithinicoccus hortensis]
MVHTVVAVNAHPDDEAILTGGTLAKLAAAGHRVVLVTATDGDAGPAAAQFGTGGELGARRLAELRASAEALGAAEVIHLGYSDSGLDADPAVAPPGRRRFVDVPVEEAAEALAVVLRRERADLVLGYDPAGGYGHPDHVRVHEVVRGAQQLAGVPRLLEATAPREPITTALRLAARLHALPTGFDPAEWAHGFTPRARITHRIDVTPVIAAKRAAMAAHLSQASGDDGSGGRNLAAVLKLPLAAYRRALGREYFVDPAATPGTVQGQIFGAPA